MPKPKIIERECQHHGLTEYVLEGRGSYRCKACRVDQVTKARRKRKQRLVDHFGGSCRICGYNRCKDALQFHHLETEAKDFGISHKGLYRSWQRMLEEASKCLLVCANCHAEIHAGIG